MEHPTILSYGSINIDQVFTANNCPDESRAYTSDVYEEFAGGKGVNQAIAAARAGSSVIHIGACGPDGEFILKLLNQAGIDTSLCRINPNGKSGRTILVLTETGDYNCLVLYSGENMKITEQEIVSFFEKLDLKSIKYVLLQNEASNGGKVMKLAHKHGTCRDLRAGIKIVLNPAPRIESIASVYPLYLMDILVANEREAFDIYFQISEQKSRIWPPLSEVVAFFFKSWQNLEIAIVTLGENGSYYGVRKADGEIIYATKNALSVKVVDTTGAGDTFLGYFLHSLETSKLDIVPAVERAVEIATFAASICIQTKGAVASIPHASQLQK